MSDNKPSGYFGALIGGIIALAAIVMVISGGELGGKKTVNSDADLPPVTSSQPSP